MYDIFFISSDASSESFISLKERFPLLKLANSFEDAKRRTFTTFFWTVWPDLIVDATFNFDYQVPHWDKDYVHVFKNGEYYDGISLQSKTLNVSPRELAHRFYINKKEIDIQASFPSLYDIIFISYNEPTADTAYTKLLERFPRAKRIHGIKGIHNAHIHAATISTTDMFYVVDADADIVDDFNFDYRIPYYDNYSKSTVHVWRSLNPVTKLEYGYGGVKLLPTNLTKNMSVDTLDMTTSISTSFKVIDKISNITAFNTDPLSTWRSAFRECTKLSVIGNEEALSRLAVWCRLNENVSYGTYAYMGAIAGKDYGEKNASNPEALSKINDFNWLSDQFIHHGEYFSNNTSAS
jgi:hypothetical protein